jgi:hypothetical protein
MALVLLNSRQVSMQGLESAAEAAGPDQHQLDQPRSSPAGPGDVIEELLSHPFAADEGQRLPEPTATPLDFEPGALGALLVLDGQMDIGLVRQLEESLETAAKVTWVTLDAEAHGPVVRSDANWPVDRTRRGSKRGSRRRQRRQEAQEPPAAGQAQERDPRGSHGAVVRI